MTRNPSPAHKLIPPLFVLAALVAALPAAAGDTPPVKPIGKASNPPPPAWTFFDKDGNAVFSGPICGGEFLYGLPKDEGAEPEWRITFRGELIAKSVVATAYYHAGEDGEGCPAGAVSFQKVHAAGGYFTR